MIPIKPDPMTQSPESLFREKLETLSQPQLFTGHLIVKEQGDLEQTNFLQSLWEKFKGIFGFRNWTNERLVEFKTLQFLSEGRKWVNSQEDVELVKALARRVGLTPSNSKDHSELQLLVDEICNTSLEKIHESEPDALLEKFITHYTKELTPFPKEILKITKTFENRVATSPPPPPTEIKDDISKEIKEQEDESEGNASSTFQQDSSHQEEKRTFIETSPTSTLQETIPTSPVDEAQELSLLLKIPTPKKGSVQDLKSPLVPDDLDEKRSYTEPPLDLAPQETTPPPPIVETKTPPSEPEIPALTPKIQDEKKEVVQEHKTEESAIQEALPKVEVITSEEIKSSRWKTAAKVAIIAVSAFAVVAATYYAWQYFRATAQLDETPPLLPDPNAGQTTPFLNDSSLQSPLDRVTSNVANITTDLANRVITYISPANTTFTPPLDTSSLTSPAQTFLETTSPLSATNVTHVPDLSSFVESATTFIESAANTVSSNLTSISPTSVTDPLISAGQDPSLVESGLNALNETLTSVTNAFSSPPSSIAPTPPSDSLISAAKNYSESLAQSTIDALNNTLTSVTNVVSSTPSSIPPTPPSDSLISAAKEYAESLAQPPIGTLKDAVDLNPSVLPTPTPTPIPPDTIDSPSYVYHIAGAIGTLAVGLFAVLFIGKSKPQTVSDQTGKDHKANGTNGPDDADPAVDDKKKTGKNREADEKKGPGEGSKANKKEKRKTDKAEQKRKEEEKRIADDEAQVKIKEEATARQKAEEDKRIKAAEEKRQIEEAELKRQKEEEKRIAAEAQAKIKEEAITRQKAEEDKKIKAAEEKRQIEEAELKRQKEEEKRIAAEAQAKIKEEQAIARQKAKEDKRIKAAEEKRQIEEAELKRQKEEEKRIAAETQAKIKEEATARQKAEEDKKIQAEAKRQEEEIKAAELQRKAEVEAAEKAKAAASAPPPPKVVFSGTPNPLTSQKIAFPAFIRDLVAILKTSNKPLFTSVQPFKDISEAQKMTYGLYQLPELSNATFIGMNQEGDFKTRAIGLAVRHHVYQNNLSYSKIAEELVTKVERHAEKLSNVSQEKLKVLTAIVTESSTNLSKVTQETSLAADCLSGPHDQEMIRFIRAASALYLIVEGEKLWEAFPPKVALIAAARSAKTSIPDYLLAKGMDASSQGNISDAYAMSQIFDIALTWVTPGKQPEILSPFQKPITPYFLLTNDKEAYLGIPPYTTEVGIRNPDNTCYRNASNQAIFNTPFLADYLKVPVVKLPNESVEIFETRRSIQKHLIALAEAIRQNKSPKEILEIEKELRNKLFFSQYHIDFDLEHIEAQYDAASYLEAILNALNYVRREQPTHRTEWETATLDPDICSTVQIPLIPKETRFQALVDASYSQQKVEQDWRGHPSYERHVKIIDPPQDVLVFHLKRRTDANTIDNRDIELPADGIIDFSKAHDFPDGTLKYKVNSFLLRESKSPSGELGHYTSYVKKNGQWYHFDDEQVSIVSEDVAKAMMAKSYLFFFEKTEDRSLELASSSTKEKEAVDAVGSSNKAKKNKKATSGASSLENSVDLNSLENRQKLGQEAIKAIKHSGQLKYTAGRTSTDIDLTDYLAFVSKQPADTKKVYSTILKLTHTLNRLKGELKDATAPGTPETEQMLKSYHDGLLALEGVKQELFQFEFKSESVSPSIKTSFKKIQELVGSDIQIPIDFKIALLTFLKENNSSEFKEYLALLHRVKKRTLTTDPEQKLSALYNPVQMYFMEHIGPAANSYFIGDFTQPQFDDISGAALSRGVNDLNTWLMAKIGVDFNTQCVTDTIEHIFNRETKETTRDTAAIRDEQYHSKYLMPEEKALAESGFRTHELYSIKVKNDWSVRTTSQGITIDWTGKFSSKKKDGSYTLSESKGTIDLTGIQGLTEEHAHKAVNLLFNYCQSGPFSQEKFERQKDALGTIPKEDRLVFNPNEDFWKWVDAGALDSDPKALTYEPEIEKTKDNFSAFVKTCKHFAQTIDHAMVKAFVDRDQLLDDVEIYDTDIDPNKDGFTLMEGLSEEEDDTTPKSLPSTASPSYFSPSNMLGAVVNIASGALTAISTPVTAVGQILINAPSQITGYLTGALTSEGPKWEKTKFTLAISQIRDHLKTHPTLPALMENRRTWETGLGKIVAPWFNAQKNPNSRYAHTEFLEGLRSTLSSPIYQEELKKKANTQSYDPLVDLVLEICKARFEENHLFTFCDNLIKEILPDGQHTGALEEHDFGVIKKVDPSKKLSALEVNAKKLQGHLNVNFDPHLQGNNPFVLGTVDIENKPVKLIRMGTPTIESGVWSTAEINPEFRGYVQSLTLENKIHLYISLQNDKFKSFYAGDESGRNEAIKGLQKDFPKNFFAVILAQDSPFYKQEDKNKDPLGDEDISVFKPEFYRQLIGTNTGFYFPEEWKNDPEFKVGLQYLLQVVHSTVYGETKTVLTREEKQDFIEIYYAYLSVFLMNYSKADNANITCKDAIDRAGKLNSLVLKLIMIIQGKNKDAQQQRVHQVFTHAPAFFVKAQAIIHSRRDRLMSAFKRMTDDEIIPRIEKANIPVQRPGKTEDGVKFFDKGLINPHGKIKITEDPRQAIES